LGIANKELAFQNSEKEKRANELGVANEELAFQNSEKEKRANELGIANKELAFQNSEKEKRANELGVANKELAYQNHEKEKRADELELIITQNEVLNQQVNHLQKLESIGRMTAGIAHDFNNILACMMGYNEMNNDVGGEIKNESLKAELASNTEQIANAGQRAMSLIEKMMTYSRQDTQSTKAIDVEHTAIAISNVLEMLRPALTSRVQLEFIHGDEFIDKNSVDINTNNYDSDIQIDVVALHQIITNLAVNARDAMKENGGVIKISLLKVIEKNTQCVACRALTEGEFIELSVSDKGTGIEPKVINRIFDPFFTTKPQGEGTGLGLSTLTGLVHSALGHIIVNSDMSESNHGTTFRLLFPIMKYGI
ncbi:MAG: ATP-binding protein, partial [Methylococcaceae bacterium]